MYFTAVQLTLRQYGVWASIWHHSRVLRPADWQLATWNIKDNSPAIMDGLFKLPLCQPDPGLVNGPTMEGLVERPLY